MVEDSPEKEVHREKLKTTVVALDLHGGVDHRHRSIDGSPHRAAPRGPAIPLPGTGGASLRLDGTQHPN